MKNRELINLYNGLTKLDKISGVKFAYEIIKTKKKLKEYITPLEESVTPSEKIKEFQTKRIDICIKYSEKDKDGQPIFIGEGTKSYKIKSLKLFNDDIKKLTKEYEDVIEIQEKKIKEYNALLEEEATIELEKIDVSIIPEDITVEQMDILQSILL